MAEQLGQVSRYRLLEPIGAGASGTVYKAAQLPSGRICALKLTGEGARHNKVAWRLAREFSVLSQLAHPNLVKVLDFGSDRAKGHYLVMEYVQGAPIGRFLARLRIEPFVAVLCQILDALSYLHSNGIVHQDLKPSHILIASGQQAEPVVKLIDLGMAFRRPKEGADEAYGGTAGYIAPRSSSAGRCPISAAISTRWGPSSTRYSPSALRSTKLTSPRPSVPSLGKHRPIHPG